MENAKISVNFQNVVGKFKPMHGVGQPPNPAYDNCYHYLTEAGIPFSRLHDVGGWLGGGLYVDVPNLFRDFDADENDPASYDFAFTDRLMANLTATGCQPYFRLGITIENLHMLKYYRLDPPKDFGKWARICEHIVRHYREGWADGFYYDITYWEIWNEPDDCYKEKYAAMWRGTPEQYFELYAVTAKHLKACFGDSIKVGGYGHCGLYEYAQDKDLNGLDHEVTRIYEFVISFMHDFFKYQQKTGAPIDFFSWHVYDNCHPSTKQDFKVIAQHAAYARRILDRYGYTHAEHHLNEWNLWTKREKRDAPNASARSLSFMLMMQNTSTDVMCYYDACMGYSDYNGLINPDTGKPYRNYYAFAAYNTLYQLGDQAEVQCSDPDLWVGAGINGRKAAIVLANPCDEAKTVELDLSGMAYTDVQVLRIDGSYRYTLTGEGLQKGVITIPEQGCVEIKLFDLDR